MKNIFETPELEVVMFDIADSVILTDDPETSPGDIDINIDILDD